MAHVIALLRRVPWWGWAALVLLLYIGVQEYRIRAADRRAAAIERRIEDAKLEDLAKERAESAEVLKGLFRERAELRGAITSARASAAKVDAQVKALDAATARVEAAGRQLVESGTVDDVVRAGRALGVAPVPMRRPR